MSFTDKMAEAIAEVAKRYAAPRDERLPSLEERLARAEARIAELEARGDQ
jgi:hypothetical protein